MQANPTDKPALPTDSQELAKLNITLPITTPQQLTQIAKTLRQYFYFKQLPSSWINITNPLTHTTDQADNTDANTTTSTKQPLPPIPDNINDIISALTSNNIQLTLLITLQSKITSTMQTLRQLYTIKTIPSFLLDLPPLPLPTWEIFNSPTTLSSKPPTTNTVAMDTS
jgi:flagellar hook-basal body complex protein FliE